MEVFTSNSPLYVFSANGSEYGVVSLPRTTISYLADDLSADKVYSSESGKYVIENEMGVVQGLLYEEDGLYYYRADRGGIPESEISIIVEKLNERYKKEYIKDNLFQVLSSTVLSSDQYT